MVLSRPPVTLSLPAPWSQPTQFTIDELPQITWLVGPNGSGKSRFLRVMRDSLNSFGARLIETDRLNQARVDSGHQQIWGANTHFSRGINKGDFDHLTNIHKNNAALASSITLLYRRPDLRIRVEATLSQLLARDIRLEMVDGVLQPRMTFRGTADYGLFSDECHGVLELIVLLANIYDDEASILLIDEPEQNLHPQYQAFVLEEIQRIQNRKFVIASHSPFFLSIKDLDDLRGVICFHPDFRPPSRYSAAPHIDREVSQVLPRMTEQHRSFFFADKPVFVEGYFDATMIGRVQAGLGFSAASAGSALIPSVGKDDAARYLLLCNALGKAAVFVFDLDALFERRLSTGAEQMDDLVRRISGSGHQRFDTLRGQLETALTRAICKIQEIADANLTEEIRVLLEYFRVESASAVKQRVALLVALAQYGEMLKACGMSAEVDSIVGIHKALLGHLASVGIHVLPGGALENYLPSYNGNPYHIAEGSKAKAVADEIEWLATKPLPADIKTRYGALGETVGKLPAKPKVEILPILQRELADVLHKTIVAIREGRLVSDSQVAGVLGETWTRVANFVSLRIHEVSGPGVFRGELEIADKFGIGTKICHFDHATQTNNPATLALVDVALPANSADQ